MATPLEILPRMSERRKDIVGFIISDSTVTLVNSFDF